MDGPKKQDIDDAFWRERSQYISRTFDVGEPSYITRTRSEFTKLENIDIADDIFLWFEHDLFCQANYWFCIAFLSRLSVNHKLHRVSPSSASGDPGWNGFGRLNASDIAYSYKVSKRLSNDDIKLGVALWNSFAVDDHAGLLRLSKTYSPTFSHLREVVQAHIDRSPINGSVPRPHATLKSILDDGITNFDDIFKEFFKREGVYGYGDLQVKEIIQQISSKTDGQER